MGRKWLLVIVMMVSVVGIAFAQTAGQPLFEPLQQIGERRPGGILYDSAFDRLVLVDLQGRLTLVDAASFQTQHILYENGAFNAYVFSHDGRWLALAIDRRVELWNTQTGERSAVFEPDGANLVQGPLLFSPDDSWLLLDTVVPAPQATRRSENDTDIIPWIWDLPAAREEAPERLRGGAEAFAFFNYRNGLVMGGDLFFIAGQPSRLQLIDGRSRDFPVIADIPASRAEQDPIYVWQSANTDLLYIDPRTGGGIVQVNAQTGTQFNVPLGRDLNYRNLESMTAMQLGSSARILCGVNSLQETPLLRLLYGDNYLSFQGYQPGTVMLIDVLEPLSSGANQPALLLYNFVESRGSGSMELFFPPDVQQMRLSPDGTRLMVRRASGLQAVEVYNLETCGLERSYYPTEPDETASRLLDYRADGEVITVDFQRFDARSGEQIAFEDQYTNPFEEYRFSDDGQRLHTFRAGELRVWDLSSGQLVQRAPIQFSGDVLAQSPDGTHYLVQNFTDTGLVIEHVNVLGGERRRMVIPPTSAGTPVQVIPSPDWGRMLALYQPQLPADPASGSYEIALYGFDQGQLLYIAGADMPAGAFKFDWVDDDRIVVSGSIFGAPDRPYGFDFHSSGLPSCLVAAFPNDYTAWLPIWEGLTLRLNSTQLANLTTRICGTLPATAGDFIPELTPTPRFTYNSLNTPVPYAIPGIPICLTQRFSNQAVDYAALWRQITADLDAEQVSVMEQMICEGLINSPFQVAPTPTIDPNLNVPPTPTAVDAGPQTTDFTETGETLYYTIDVRSGDRFAATYAPELVRRPRPNPDLLFNFYIDQFNEAPLNPVLSLDGTRYAVTDRNGFVTIYRLTRSYDQLVQDERDAAATRQAEAPRSIGLQPTATQPAAFIGGVRPTLTPTVTPTSPGLPQTTPATGAFNQTTDVCPARNLYTLESPPPDFNVSGRLLTRPPVNGFNSTWVLEPGTGRYVADDSIPPCGFDGNCNFSPDRNWIVRVTDAVIISRPDGTDAFILFQPAESNYFPQSYRWLSNTVLEYIYPGYVTNELAERIRAEQGEAAFRSLSGGQISLYRTFDVSTQQRSEPYIPPRLDASIEGLPTSIVARQPIDGSLLIVSTPYPPFGAKYYLYDLRTQTYSYFVRVDAGSLNFEWQPNGRYLYYQVPGDFNMYQYAVETGEHRLIGQLPFGDWSRDSRYRMTWYSMPGNDYTQRIAARELPFKLQIWDSETGSFRRYCIPESGLSPINGSPFTWSPDGRYVAFTLPLPPEGDVFPVPTPEVGIITPQPGDPAFITPTTTPMMSLGNVATPTFAPDMLPTIPPADAAAEIALQPTLVPNSSISLEQQYQYRNPRTLILDTQTGSITVVSTEVNTLLLWLEDGGTP
jgi:WD40 repeat protein